MKRLPLLLLLVSTAALATDPPLRDIQVNGARWTPQPTVDFAGSGVSYVDDPDNKRGIITFSGGGGGGGGGGVDSLTCSPPITCGASLTAITISLANSGVTAATYGSATAVGVCTYNAKGVATSCSTTPIAGLNASVLSAGTLPVARGGTNATAGGSLGAAAVWGSGNAYAFTAAPSSIHDVLHGLPSGTGIATWGPVDLVTADVTGVLPIANGGTGSATRIFVQTTGNETIAGIKTFSSTIIGSINGNAATVTNGVYTSDARLPPSPAPGNTGLCLVSDGGAWVAGSCSGGGVDASSIQGIAVDTADPVDKDVLCYASGSGKWQPCSSNIDEPGTSGRVLIDSGTRWVSKAISGDVTITSLGAVTLAASGVTASTYGSATQVPVCTFDVKGRATTCTNTTIALAASAITSGQLGSARGGTAADLSACTGVPTFSTGTASCNTVLPIASGGTNASAIGAAGSIPYSSAGTSQGWSNAYTSGYVWTSGGTGAPVAVVTVPVANGGTNIASYTIGDLLQATATTTISTGTPRARASSAGVAAGSYLRSGGVATANVWSTLTLPNAATIGDVLTATGTNAVGVLAAGVTAGYALMSNGSGAALSYQQPGVVADAVVANAGTTINTNVDTTVYTVPTAPTNHTIFVVTGVVGRISQAGVASSGTPTHTLSVGKTAGGQGFLVNQSVLIATAINTKFGFTITQLGSEFISADGYNAYLSAGDTVVVRYAIANSGGISTQMITRWTVTGYWI